MILEQLFNDREKEEINRFVNNPTMLEAVKKVILSAVYFDGTIRKEGIPDTAENFALGLAVVATNDMKVTDAKLGKELKTALAAVQILEKGFLKLQRFNEKKPKEKVEPHNQAR